tara:strand:+ start:11392 stop:11631 length:240 start_codon:yes stop_codon:yes gene_type:complete
MAFSALAIAWTTAVVISGVGISDFVMPGSARAHSKGLYATEAEARQRAEQIGCNAVHENNGRWMPCANERELHQQLRKQ